MSMKQSHAQHEHMNRNRKRKALNPSLLLALGLALACTKPGTALAAMDRAVDGFEHSGYFFPKTMIWHGIRSSPGSLWLFFVIFLYCCYDLFVLSLATTAIAGILKLVDVPKPDDLDVEANINSKSNSAPAPGPAAGPASAIAAISQAVASLGLVMNAEGARVTAALGFGVLFVSLSATQLSEIVETYLVAMVSIQLLLQLGSTPWALNGLLGLQFGAVFGIAMLDSYRPLNLLNVTYFAVALFMLLMSCCCVYAMPFIRRRLFACLSCLQMGFSIAAFVVARKVEGTHRSPMLALLCTACVCTGFNVLQALCLGSMLDMDKDPQTGVIAPVLENMVKEGFGTTHSFP